MTAPIYPGEENQLRMQLLIHGICPRRYVRLLAGFTWNGFYVPEDVKERRYFRQYSCVSST